MEKPYKAKFKKGEWTPVAIAGESVDGRIITREFLENVVSKYNPKNNGIHAKIKIGHGSPEGTEASAYGYFDEIRMSPVNPDIMEGKPEWVHEQLIEKLELGEYKDISPEFRPIIKRTGETNEEGIPLFSCDYYFGGVAVLGASHPAFPILSTYSANPSTAESLSLPNITYTAKDIVIEQNANSYDTGSKQNKPERRNITVGALRNQYKKLREDYDFMEKENQRIVNQYSETISKLKEEINSLKIKDKSKRILDFVKNALDEGKMESYELMKEKPSDGIEDSKLFKHWSTMSDEQLEFEIKRINCRKSKRINQQLVNIKNEEYKNYTEIEPEDLEERKFLDFCTERKYNLKNTEEVDRAYKEWRDLC